MIQRTRPCVRVVVSTAADRRWRDVGRPHFVNRSAFEYRHRRARRWRWLAPMRALSVSPFIDVAVALTITFLPILALWRATQWLCPPAAAVAVWTARQLRRVGRSAGRSAHRALWRRPCERLGTSVTSWLWLASVCIVAVAVSLITGRLWGLVSSLPVLAALIGSWHVLRWWRRRAFRPRAMPARRWRFTDD